MPTAFIPVIKFVVNGVAVDLLLARLRLPQIRAASVPTRAVYCTSA